MRGPVQSGCMRGARILPVEDTTSSRAPDEHQAATSLTQGHEIRCLNRCLRRHRYTRWAAPTQPVGAWIVGYASKREMEWTPLMLEPNRESGSRCRSNSL